MVVLFIDTSNQMLAVGLEIDEKLVYKKEYNAFKRQSELLAKEVDTCLKANDITPRDVNKVVVTNGPGSYTGIRIGLTFAKVFAASLGIELVLISSLHALAGVKKDALALIDAKGKRAFYGKYSEGKVIKEDSVDYLDNIEIKDCCLCGDAYLFNKVNEGDSIVENMFKLYKNLASCDPKEAKARYLKD